MRLPARLFLSLFAAAQLVAGCASAPPGSRAKAVVKAVYGQNYAGVVEFDQQGDDAVVYMRFAGLPTNGTYGIHVHEKGSCIMPTLESAGPIFDPTGSKPHGPQNRDHKLGDLPNLVANEEGIVDSRYVVRGMKVADLIGRSVVVHRYADDYHTQPEGNSGDRMSCGVIK